jgi:hypothetical protein
VKKTRQNKNLISGGYFGSTFISHLLSRFARDEGRQCRALGLADAAVSPARLTRHPRQLTSLGYFFLFFRAA